jgi:hypothetical protein
MKRVKVVSTTDDGFSAELSMCQKHIDDLAQNATERHLEYEIAEDLINYRCYFCTIENKEDQAKRLINPNGKNTLIVGKTNEPCFACGIEAITRGRRN